MIGPVLLLGLAWQAPAAGAPYWQQRLEYDITARLDEPTGVLGGTERVLYHNNSPDTLHSVSFHLYLNAFRPGSRWADADSVEGRRRYNDLGDPDFGFNRIHDVLIDGAAAQPVYPYAPDSTIVRFALPRAVAPGGTFTVSLGWEARPSTVPRRQGRQGRAYDFAEWYPRVVAYDRLGWAEHALYPAGEFYGDFGDFRVSLDLPEDQVVGATGVPVCGDPGWERVNQQPGRPVELGRDAYGAPDCSGLGSPGPGRKRLLWVARDVHHFAMSLNPEYRYEGGRIGNILVHVLYRPGDNRPGDPRRWGGGIAVTRTETALGWLDSLFGAYPWPQLTNVHRIDRGSTEFPMMVHNSSATQGLILHEVGHNYLMGILANNEWREGYLDEGFTDFQTAWYSRLQGTDGYPATEREILLSDLDQWSEPVSLPGERYRDFRTYNRMTYARGQLFFEQLRTLVGDSTMRMILRTYYQRWKLRHVDEAAFRAVAEEVSHRDLSTFFGQWLHGTTLYDYAVGRVRAEPKKDAGGDRWITRVEVVRQSQGIFPVEVLVRSATDSALVRSQGVAEREWVQVETGGRPREVMIDPGAVSHDWNMLNNRSRRSLFGFRRSPRRSYYLDRLFSQPIRRDGLTVGLVPTIWYNDLGGVTPGFRVRTDYLGRFEQSRLLVSVDSRSRKGGGHFLDRVGVDLRLENPVRFRMPRTTQRLEAYRVEGRGGAALSFERQLNQHQGLGAQRWAGGGLRWLVTTDTRYLDPALWDGGGTVEAEHWIRSENSRGTWIGGGRISLAGGVEYRNRGIGLTTTDSYDAQPYLRFTAEAHARREVGRLGSFALRGFAGWVESGHRPLKQRQLFVAGADPYQQFANPFLRSRGSLLAGSDVHYAMPGGGGVRGLARGTSSTRLLALNAEASRRVFSVDSAIRRTDSTRSRNRFLTSAHLVLFGDGAVGNGDIPRPGEETALVADAGVGIRLEHRIGQTAFVTRLDFPLLVTRPRLAVDGTEGSMRFRWVISFTPAL